MKTLHRIGILSFFTISVAIFCSFTSDKQGFYHAFASNSHADVDAYLSAAKSDKSVGDAYRGALLMKKSAFIPVPKDKIAVFKQGMQLLEREIQESPKNYELRFLRFVIQEQSPAILGYKKNLAEDKKLVLDHFAQLDGTVQNFIKAYAEKSATLSTKELHN